MTLKRQFPAAALALMFSGCSEEGLSTAEAERAAEDRIRQTYNLRANTDLATTIFVGRPRDGDVVLCGLTTDPTGRVPPQRFIAATEPARWLQMAPAHSASIPARTDKFVEWDEHCAGADGRNNESLAPPPAGEQS